MEENMSNTILLELQKLNGHFDHMQEEMQNKFALMDARFNTLEEIVLTMQEDIVSLQEKITNVEEKLQERISTVEKLLQERISTVEESLQERISTVEESLQERISAVEKSLQDEISKLQDRMTTIENITLRMEYTFHDKISALFDAHSYSNDQYHKLDKRIRQNEIKIANLSLSNL